MSIAKMLLTFVLTFSAVGAGVFGIITMAIRVNDLREMARKYREWQRSLGDNSGDDIPW